MSRSSTSSGKRFRSSISNDNSHAKFVKLPPIENCNSTISDQSLNAAAAAASLVKGAGSSDAGSNAAQEVVSIPGPRYTGTEKISNLSLPESIRLPAKVPSSSLNSTLNSDGEILCAQVRHQQLRYDQLAAIKETISFMYDSTIRKMEPLWSMEEECFAGCFKNIEFLQLGTSSSDSIVFRAEVDIAEPFLRKFYLDERQKTIRIIVKLTALRDELFENSLFAEANICEKNIAHQQLLNQNPFTARFIGSYVVNLLDKNAFGKKDERNSGENAIWNQILTRIANDRPSAAEQLNLFRQKGFENLSECIIEKRSKKNAVTSATVPSTLSLEEGNAISASAIDLEVQRIQSQYKYLFLVHEYQEGIISKSAPLTLKNYVTAKSNGTQTGIMMTNGVECNLNNCKMPFESAEQSSEHSIEQSIDQSAGQGRIRNDSITSIDFCESGKSEEVITNQRKLLLQVLIQIMYCCMCFERTQTLHQDLHPDNIFIDWNILERGESADAMKSEPMSFLYYLQLNETHAIKFRSPIHVRIFDFDNAVWHNEQSIRNFGNYDKFRLHAMSKRNYFLPGHDILGILNFLANKDTFDVGFRQIISHFMATVISDPELKLLLRKQQNQQEKPKHAYQNIINPEILQPCSFYKIKIPSSYDLLCKTVYDRAFCDGLYDEAFSLVLVSELSAQELPHLNSLIRSSKRYENDQRLLRFVGETYFANVFFHFIPPSMTITTVRNPILKMSSEFVSNKMKILIEAFPLFDILRGSGKYCPVKNQATNLSEQGEVGSRSSTFLNQQYLALQSSQNFSRGKTNGIPEEDKIKICYDIGFKALNEESNHQISSLKNVCIIKYGNYTRTHPVQTREFANQPTFLSDIIDALRNEMTFTWNCTTWMTMTKRLLHAISVKMNFTVWIIPEARMHRTKEDHVLYLLGVAAMLLSHPIWHDMGNRNRERILFHLAEKETLTNDYDFHTEEGRKLQIAIFICQIWDMFGNRLPIDLPCFYKDLPDNAD